MEIRQLRSQEVAAGRSWHEAGGAGRAGQPGPAGAQPGSAGETKPAASIVSISDAARRLHAAVTASPEIRLDRVAELRRRIEDGTYSVDPARLARALLERSHG
jgi:flagellar biosynthesis anti-sigma factor FlgM